MALDLENTKSNRLLFLILSLVVIGPMTMISNYSKFYKWSRIGNVFAFSCLMWVGFYDIDRLRKIEY